MKYAEDWESKRVDYCQQERKHFTFLKKKKKIWRVEGKVERGDFYGCL